MALARQFSAKNKDVFQVVGVVFVVVGVVGSGVYATMGWKKLEEKVSGMEKNLATKEALVKVETEVKNLATNLATKETVSKVETEVKNLATKAEMAKVETEVKNVLQHARLEGQNAALKAWNEKEASVAGGKASLGTVVRVKGEGFTGR